MGTQYQAKPPRHNIRKTNGEKNASARPYNVGLPPCEDVRSRRRRWCRSSEPSGQFLGGPRISCVAPHTYIEWKAKFNAIWQISANLRRSRPLSGKWAVVPDTLSRRQISTTSQSNCLLGKHITLD